MCPAEPGLVEVFANRVNHTPSRVITGEYELRTEWQSLPQSYQPLRAIVASQPLLLTKSERRTENGGYEGPPSVWVANHNTRGSGERKKGAEALLFRIIPFGSLNWKLLHWCISLVGGHRADHRNNATIENVILRPNVNKPCFNFLKVISNSTSPLWSQLRAGKGIVLGL